MPASYAADKAAAEAKVAAAANDAAALAAARPDAGQVPESGPLPQGQTQKGLTARAATVHTLPHSLVKTGRRGLRPVVTSWHSSSTLMVGLAAATHPDAVLHHAQICAWYNSVTWSLFFIFLLYFTAPALAVLVVCDVQRHCGNRSPTYLPGSLTGGRRSAGLMSIVDVNMDGIVQLAEIKIGPDIVVLATPEEIAGLPYVVSGMSGGRWLGCRPVDLPMVSC